MKLLTTIGVVLLVILLLCTATLYILPNIGEIWSALQGSDTSTETEAPVTNGLTTAPAVSPSASALPSVFSDDDTSPQPTDDDFSNLSFRPESPDAYKEAKFVRTTQQYFPFIFPELLSSIEPTIEQVIVVLAQDSIANYWLVEKFGTDWLVIAGPLYCRTGKEGITSRKTDGDSKTPVALTSIRKVYSTHPVESLLPSTTLNPSAVWVTDPDSPHYNRLVNGKFDGISYNSSTPLSGGPYQAYIDIGWNPDSVPGLGAAIFIRSSPSLSTPSDGSINLLHSELLFVLAWLDPIKKPAVLIDDATLLSWDVSKQMDGSFLYLTDVVPNLSEDLVFSGSSNMLGRPLSGYYGFRAIAAEETSEVLSIAADILADLGFGLIVYDAYRPFSAVEDILDWLQEPDDPLTKATYYPNFDKTQLYLIFQEEFDGHSKGLALDLSLYILDSGEILDMGCEYGCYATTAVYSSSDITAAQFLNRKVLRDAMQSAGFLPYDKLWWHFSLPNQKNRSLNYDFIIAQ